MFAQPVASIFQFILLTLPLFQLPTGSLQRLAMRYAHTLLFVCPDCNLPIAVSRISHAKNCEGIDGLAMRVKCVYCEQSSDLLAVTAKTHWVTEWHDVAESSEA
jgi:uncharacterized protein YlaI